MYEKFRLVTVGKLAPEGDKNKIAQYLVKHKKLNIEFVKKIFSGQPVVLAKALDWEKAKTFQANFLKLGLLTDIRLQLDRECLVNSLKEAPKLSTQEATQSSTDVEHSPQPAPSRLYLKFDTNHVKPTLLAPATESEVIDENEEIKQRLSLHRIQLNPLMLVVVGLFLALAIEMYVLELATKTVTNNTLSSILGIVVFIGILVFFPKLSQTRQLVTLHGSNSKNDLIVEELFSSSFNEKEYLFRNGNGELVGHVMRTRRFAYYENIDGETLFSMDSENEVKEGATEFNKDVSQELVDNSPIGSALTIFETTKRAYTKLIQREKNRLQTIETQGIAILDADDKHIASLNSDNSSLYFVSPPQDETERQHYIAFAWLLNTRFML